MNTEPAETPKPETEIVVPEVTEEHHDAWLETFQTVATQPPSQILRHALFIDLPYIVMLSAAVLGIGLVTYSGDPMLEYWQFLTPIFGVICVVAGWRHAPTTAERFKLIWTQALHWLAFVVAMWLIHMPTVRDVVNDNATGLNLMTLLALATFVAGVHAEAWQICVVGLIMAITVPAMAWVQQSALFMVILALGVAFVAVSLWLTFHKAKKRAAAEAEAEAAAAQKI